MNTALKGLLFSLLALALLRASPALSVPLAPGADGPDASVSEQYNPYRQVGGDSEEGEAKARIVDRDQLVSGPEAPSQVPHAAYGMTGPAMSAGGHSGSPGWLKPAAAVGAGSALYVLLAGKGKDGNGGSANGSPINTSDGTPDLTTLGGHDETPGGDQPSEVPEPGTIAMLGIGIASLLGSRKIAKRNSR